MLRYWTTWNFIWFIYNEIYKKGFNYPLRSSIITTSIAGGLVTHIYPRKCKLRIFSYSWKISRPVHILGDVIFHHLPLYRILTATYIPSPSICGFYTIAPSLFYIYYNKLRGIDCDKTYGINFDIATLGCVSSIFIQGLIYHKFHKKIK
jgi:hypothetical protein